MSAFLPVSPAAPLRHDTASRPQLSSRQPPASATTLCTPTPPSASTLSTPPAASAVPIAPCPSPPKRRLPSASLQTPRPSPWRCSLPQSYDHLDSEPGHSDNTWSLAWKDRVALYAQFSAEETLDMLLLALQENSWSGPTKDDGIDALYAFANVDIWALTHRFFGKKMDLGQFERFKRVLVASPYDALLRYRRVRTLSALKVDDETYVSRRVFEAPGRVDTVFTFTMSRAAFGGSDNGKRAWMVDSIIHDPVQ